MARIMMPFAGSRHRDDDIAYMRQTMNDKHRMAYEQYEIEAPIERIMMALGMAEGEIYVSYPEIYLARDLTEEEQAHLPYYYYYEPRCRRLFRDFEDSWSSRDPDGKPWCPWGIVLHEGEDPLIGSHTPGGGPPVSSDHRSWYMQLWKYNPHTQLHDEANWDNFTYRQFIRSDGTRSWKEYKIMPISSYANDQYMAPNGGLSYGFNNDYMEARKNTTTKLTDTLFPKWTIEKNAMPVSAGRALDMGVAGYRVEPIDLDPALFSKQMLVDGARPIMLGVRDDGTGYRRIGRPAWMEGEEWDVYATDEEQLPISRVYIWRSKAAWHFLFAMLSHTRSVYEREIPCLVLTPMTFEHDPKNVAPMNLRGLPPKILSELHRVPGLTHIMRFALNSLQGRLLKLSKAGFDRSRITNWMVEDKKGAWESVCRTELPVDPFPRSYYIPNLQQQMLTIATRFTEGARKPAMYAYMKPAKEPRSIQPLQRVATVRQLDL